MSNTGNAPDIRRQIESLVIQRDFREAVVQCEELELLVSLRFKDGVEPSIDSTV